MFRYGPSGFHHAPGVFGWLFLALIAALLVLGVIALVRLWGTPRSRGLSFPMGTPPSPGVDAAIAELRLRYARGDITWEEYVQRSSNLGFPFPPGTGPSGSPPGTRPPPPAP